MNDIEILVVIIVSKDAGKTPMKITPILCDEKKEACGNRVREKGQTQLDREELGGWMAEEGLGELLGILQKYDKYLFQWAYDVQSSYTPSRNDSSIVLSYPKAHIYGHEIFLASHFFGAHLNHNFRNEGLPTALEAVDAMALFYVTKANGYIQKRRLQQWEMSLLRSSQERNFSTLFDFYLYGDQVVLITFAIASPLLAALSSFAVAGWLGIPYNSIMSFTPILVLGIGVDDAFLLLHSWRFNKHQINVAKRMAIVITEIGPSISITSITNMLAFGVGTFSPAPMMSTFCCCTALAVALDFIYELAMFAPVLVISSRWESAEQQFISRIDPTRCKSNKGLSYWWRYAEFVVCGYGRITLIIVVVSIYVFSFLGIQRMNATFDPSKTFPSDSPLMDSLRFVDDLYEQYAPIDFIVNRPPNISDSVDYERFMTMLQKLEHLPGSYGYERSLLWLRDYDAYYRTAMNIPLNSSISDGMLSYEFVPDFLDSKMMADKNVVRFHFDQSWWGLDMDPITMISVLMAIGLSVDFSAHICYHFYNYKRPSIVPNDHRDERVVKLATIFESIGKPMVEAAASTVLCMLPLFAIQIYTIVSFAKTVCVVASLGTLHGVFILPAVLTIDICEKRETYRQRTLHTPIISSSSTAKNIPEEQLML
uniref:SSD domain-containing protein n=1 Tax=Ascaris lumbricoides TaxID=6252 RepID=A0A9J2PWF6_ASCLU